MSHLNHHLVIGIGLEQPRHWYHVGRVVHSAAELQLFRPQRTLLLGNDLTGANELVGLGALGETELTPLLASATRGRPPGERLIVELPGVRDAAGESPFWQGLGHHFCPLTPDAAAGRHGAAWQGHVAALLPRQLVYASFLPQAAQDAIGACGAGHRALLAALQRAGFAWHGHIGIGDGGPVLEWVAPS